MYFTLPRKLPSCLPNRFGTDSFLWRSLWTMWQPWACNTNRIPNHQTWFTRCTRQDTWRGALGTAWPTSGSCFWILLLFYVFFEQWIPGQTSCWPDCFKSLKKFLVIHINFSLKPTSIDLGRGLNPQRLGDEFALLGRFWSSSCPRNFSQQSLVLSVNGVYLCITKRHVFAFEGRWTPWFSVY